MNELLQSAQHPDADQLTAFAEHALPAHEREQTLAHLATCAQCRQLVFLAQAEEPVEVPEPVEVKKPWFGGWNLVWTAALAFGAIATFSVLLRHATTGPEQKVAVVADAPTIPILPAPVPVMAPPVAKPLPRVVAKQAAPSAAPAGVTATNGDLQREAPLQTQAFGQERSRDKVPAILHGPMISQQQQMLGAAAAAPAQNFAQSQVSSAAAAPPKPVVMGGMAGGVGRAASAAPASVTVTLGETVRAAGVAAPPPAAPKPPPQAAAQTMNVDALSDMAASNASATVLGSVSTASGLIAAELPNGKAAISRVSNGSVTVALDAAGAVFVSKDAGVHWTAVKAQWSGRAVQVSLNGASAPEARALSKVAAQPQADPGLRITRNAAAAGPRAQVAGSVTDAAGAFISGATILVKNAAGTTVTTTRTDRNGSFTSGALDPGKYAVQISSPGFETFIQTLELRPGDRALLGAKLQVGAEAQTIDVETASAELKAAKTKPEPFTLVTDTGVTFTSTDGQRWKRR